MTRLLSFLIIITVFSKPAIAQVPNNNIQNRLELKLDDHSLFSSTAKSTVEWSCISKALTNKCLVYHNDQWFKFSVPAPGTYFINLSAQKCRDMKGLQLIIIEGNPCDVKTYRILQCIPQIRQEDVFVQLDSLSQHTEYLVNVDGFLGDFCEFEIQVSKKPGGLPRTYQQRDTISSKIVQQGRLISIGWSLTEDQIDQLQSFKIYRTQPDHLKADLIAEQTVSRNTYGAYVLNYTVTDSLKNEGKYEFRVFGIDKQTQFPSLLATHNFQYTLSKPKMVPQSRIALHLDFEGKAQFNVMVFDKDSNQLLKKKVKPEDVSGPLFELDLGEFINQGQREFMVLISNEDSRDAREYYYSVNSAGQIVQQ